MLEPLLFILEGLWQADVEQREQKVTNCEHMTAKFKRLFAKEALITESHSLGDEHQAEQQMEQVLDGASLAVQAEAKLVREQASAVTDIRIL